MEKIASRWLSVLRHGSPSLLLGGLGVILLVCLSRAFGLIQGIELKTLDLFLRWRPPEAVDDRITIIEFTDADIQALGTYPVPDETLYQLLTELETYAPRAIGLDIFRDIPVANSFLEDAESAETANQALNTLLQQSQTIVSIEKVLDAPVGPPPNVPQTNIGFADALLDQDGFVRRSLLGTSISNNSSDFRLSLTIQLVSRYLEAEGFELTNGIKDPDAMRFGSVELFSLGANSGSYVNQDTGNNPVILINFRSHPQPFKRLSFSEFRSGEIEADWFRDRIVLIGMTAASTKDYINSAAIVSSNPGLVPGVQLQGHAISQIVSAVLDGRPLLQPLAAKWDYFWIVTSGLVSLSLIFFNRSVYLELLLFLSLSTLPLVVGYGLLLNGIWLPIFPIWVVCLLNGGSVVLYRIYQREQDLKIRIDERQLIIKQSYDAIHNHPLQTLKQLIRSLSTEENHPSLQTVNAELSKVDQELRNIYDFMQREHASLDAQMYLNENHAIDLNEPLHELLHQVYRNQLSEMRSYFDQVKLKLPDFSPLDTHYLSFENKQGVVRFLEEALCNVAQHAKGVTRLTVVCEQQEGYNRIKVMDNGLPRMDTPPFDCAGGQGTRQAKALASRLSGRFSRYPLASRGMVCQLAWPIRPPSLQHRLQQWFQRWLPREQVGQK